MDDLPTRNGQWSEGVIGSPFVIPCAVPPRSSRVQAYVALVQVGGSQLAHVRRGIDDRCRNVEGGGVFIIHPGRRVKGCL